MNRPSGAHRNRLHSRASFRAASLSPNQTLGSLVEIMAVATPLLSMSSMDLLGVHNSSGRWLVLRSEMAAMNPGAEKW